MQERDSITVLGIHVEREILTDSEKDPIKREKRHAGTEDGRPGNRPIGRRIEVF